MPNPYKIRIDGKFSKVFTTDQILSKMPEYPIKTNELSNLIGCSSDIILTNLTYLFNKKVVMRWKIGHGYIWKKIVDGEIINEDYNPHIAPKKRYPIDPCKDPESLMGSKKLKEIVGREPRTKEEMEKKLQEWIKRESRRNEMSHTK